MIGLVRNLTQKQLKTLILDEQHAIKCFKVFDHIKITLTCSI